MNSDSDKKRQHNQKVPAKLKGLSWGAFVFSWIWGIFNKTYIAFLSIIFPIGMNIILLIKGKEWAWQNKKWKNIESFKKTQRNWDIAGLSICGTIFFFIIIVGIRVLIAFLVVTSTLAGRIPQQDLPPISNAIQAEIERLDFIDDIKPVEGMTNDESPQLFTVELSIGYKRGDNNLRSELEAHIPQFRNIVLKILGSKKAEELSIYDLSLIERDILYSLNQIVSSGKIKSVLFTKFQVFTPCQNKSNYYGRYDNDWW